MKILVADDDDDSRKVLEVLLKREKFEVIATGNGDDALHHLFGSAPPEIAILDWMMPGQSGVDLCKRVREFSKEHYTYLILLTARSQQEDVIAGLQAGADDYLAKPYDVKEFLLRVAAGRRLIELQQQLARQNELLQDINYALAHDLKTPLIAINMTTADAIDGLYGEIPSDYKPVLKKTKDSVDWLLRLTETMRTLARVENAAAQQTMQEIDLHDLCLKCVSELEPLLRSKKIKVDVVAPETALEVGGYAQDLQRLLINLLDNAIKFTPEDGNITVTMNAADANIRVSIADSGPGIPEADRPLLLQRFSTRANKHHGSGTGLGLYLCKRIVDMHYGKLVYEDGAFTFEIPKNVGVAAK